MSKSRGPGLIFHSENLDIHNKGSFVKGTVKTVSKASQKKGGKGLGQRKALQDISNAPSFHQEGSTKKKGQIKEEFNVFDERFLHDHEQCLRARKVDMDPNLCDPILFDDDTAVKPEQTEADCESPPRHLELESIPETEIPAMTWCPSPINLPSESPLCRELPDLIAYRKGSMSKAQGPQSIKQSDNSDIRRKESVIKDKLSNVSKASQKKVEKVFGQRKALQDISNISSLRQEASKNKSHTSEEINIAEEGFLHDHEQCIRARKAEMDAYLYDAVVFEDGLLYPDAAQLKQVEVGCGSPPRYLDLEPIPELEIPAMTWCPSPIPSPPLSPLWYELPELVLKVMID